MCACGSHTADRHTDIQAERQDLQTERQILTQRERERDREGEIMEIDIGIDIDIDMDRWIPTHTHTHTHAYIFLFVQCLTRFAGDQLSACLAGAELTPGFDRVSHCAC